MKITKTLLGVLAITLAVAMHAHSQTYQFSAPLSGYLTMSAQDLNGSSGSSGIFTNEFDSISETVYLDTVSNTIRQVGAVFYTSSASNIQFQETQSGVPGTVTVDLGPTGGFIPFDTGVQTMTWDASSSNYMVDTSFLFPIPISGSYSLVTGGETYSNSFAYSINDNEGDNYVAAQCYYIISLGQDYPGTIQLSGIRVCCYQGVLFPSPGIVADVQASNGFEMKLSPGINLYWWPQYAPGEIFSWSSDPVTATNGGGCSYPASATATVVDGFVVSATIISGGCGYANSPFVLIQGGGGTGATATAVVSNGVVVDIEITDAGAGYTNAPSILIGEYPSISIEPQSVTVNANYPATFSVAAAGPPLSYQWLFNGTNISGATSSTLTVPSVVQTNLGNYAVVVTNPFGVIVSSNAALSMYPFLVDPFGGLITDWGYTNALTVGAWGTGPLSYQWFDNGVAIANATSSTLTLADIQFTNAGLYSVVVSSPFGSVTNAAEQVVVNPAGASIGLYPGVTISGVAGFNYVVQRTANLQDTNSWVTVANVTLAQPTQIWVDTNNNASLPGNPKQFYRILPGQ
jgi:hypothetical protein